MPRGGQEASLGSAELGLAFPGKWEEGVRVFFPSHRGGLGFFLPPTKGGGA